MKTLGKFIKNLLKKGRLYDRVNISSPAFFAGDGSYFGIYKHSIYRNGPGETLSNILKRENCL